MNKIKDNNKGITLIALIITIIVMLILVAVTISMAINGGLFEYAGKATEDTKNEINKEQELANGKVTIDNKVYNSIDEYLNSKEETNGVDLNLLGIGDYVNYPVEYTNVATSYDTSTGEEIGIYPRDEFTGWRVLSKETDDQGNVLYIKLISAGVPLSYYHYADSNINSDSGISITNLTTNFLKTEITSNITQNKFYKHGFKNVTGSKLENTFANEFTDKVTALTKDELDKAIVDLGGSTTTNMTYVNGIEYKNLFALPLETTDFYAATLLATPYYDIHLCYVASEGCVIDNGRSNSDTALGVRVVVSLVPEVQFIAADTQINNTPTWDIF